MALGDNLARYEANFGEVELDEMHGHPNVPLNFGGQTGQA
jgi:hypothetical protein